MRTNNFFSYNDLSNEKIFEQLQSWRVAVSGNVVLWAWQVDCILSTIFHFSRATHAIVSTYQNQQSCSHCSINSMECDHHKRSTTHSDILILMSVCVCGLLIDCFDINVATIGKRDSIVGWTNCMCHKTEEPRWSRLYGNRMKANVHWYIDKSCKLFMEPLQMDFWILTWFIHVFFPAEMAWRNSQICSNWFNVLLGQSLSTDWFACLENSTFSRL